MTKLISYALWYLIYLVSLLPKGFFYFLSDILAFLLRKVFKYRTSVVYVNLARSFPDLKYRELDKIVKEYYTYMCDIFMESIWSISANDRQLAKMISVKNPELLDELAKKHDKIVMLLGHRSNWELMAAICGDEEFRKKHYYPQCNLNVGYKRANSKIANFLFEKIRNNEYKKVGNKGHIVASKSILRDVLKTTEKSIYLFIADQTPVRVRGVAKFLNQKTLMFTGAEDISTKLNLPVVYMRMDCLERGKYEISFDIISETPKDTARYYITREYASLLEQDIISNKYNWLWSHRRWKRDLTEQEEKEYSQL